MTTMARGDARARHRRAGPARCLAAVALLGVLLSSAPAAAGAAEDDGRQLEVDATNVVRMIRTLSSCCNMEGPPADAEGDVPVTRVVFSEEDVLARATVKSWMVDLGLAVREDAIGNIFGVWEREGDADADADADAGPVLTGSHVDAIPLSGQYDGVLGVVGALEAVRALRASGFVPRRRSIEVIYFTSEEPTRFGLSCLGSRAMAGTLEAADAAALRDEGGGDLMAAAAAAGYGAAFPGLAAGAGGPPTLGDVLSSVRADALRRNFSAFVELHIEQASVLEEAGEQLGVVTAIAAPAYLRYTFTGDGGHAGALLMKYRHDAGLAAAELAVAAEEAALRQGSDDIVATVGRIDLSPGAVNSVPRIATVHLDVRDVDQRRRDRVVGIVDAAAEAIAGRRGVGLAREVVSEDPAMASDGAVVDAVRTAAGRMKAEGRPPVRWRQMVSRAYHDSTFMGMFVPTAMIFIPCRGGFSHRPDEFASEGDIALGVRALALTLRELSERDGGGARADDGGEL